MTPLYEESAYYVTCGLSVLPVAADGTKSPDGRVLPFEKDPITGDQLSTWKPFQFHHPDDMYLRKWFDCQKAERQERGIGIIGGKVSNNLEILDFDESGIFEELWQIVVDNELDHYFDRAPVVATPSGGKHLYYYVDGAPCVNDKLARAANRKTRIETKGEGGYVVAPPSGGKVHATGGSYRLESGNFSYIPVVPADVVNALHGFARLFNLFIEAEKQPVRETISVHEAGELKPGEDFNRRGCIEDLLIEAGWRCTATRRNGAQMWARPDKAGKVTSATLHAVAHNVFYVFSSNASPFETEHGYDPFGVYCALKHNGDYKAAVAQLGKDGYGISEAVYTERVEAKKKEQRVAVIEGFDEYSLDALAELDQSKKTPTELELAEEWVKTAKHVLSYVEGDQWYLYQDNRWHYSSLEVAHRMVQDFLIAKLASGTKLTVNRSRLTGVLFIAKSMLGPHAVAEFDNKPGWIGMRNGVYDVATGVLMPHKPEYLMMHQVPYDYDEHAECPRWTRFLSEVLIKHDRTPSEEWIMAIQEWFGMALLPDPTIQAAHFWVGDGQNGKGVATRVLTNLIGSQYCTAISVELLNDQYNRAELFGKRVGFVNEPDPKAMQKNGSHFKAITGGDLISARRPTEKVFTFTFQGRIILSCNELPSTRDLSNGYFRRVILIEWRYKIPDELKDIDLDEKLSAEISGIFNWAVKGLQRVRANKRLSQSEDSATLLAKYRNSEDAFGRFFEETLKRDTLGSAPVAKVYSAFKKWAVENGEFVLSSHRFTQRLEKMGYERYVDRVKNIGENTWRSVKSWRSLGFQNDQISTDFEDYE